MAMTKTKTIIHTLRRISTIDAARRASKESISVPPPTGHDASLESHAEDDEERATASTQQSPLALPPELLAHIVDQLTYQEICALRLTCSPFQERLSKGDVIRQWARTHLNSQLKTLYPIPAIPTFSYVANQNRRQLRARHLASVYAEYIEWNVVRYSLQRRHPYIDEVNLHREFRPVAETMRTKLYKLLLTAQHYLESCANALLELCAAQRLAGDARVSEQQCFTRENRVLASYEPKHLRELYDFWMFLTWLNNQILNRPSYVGTFERAVRGWMTDPLQKYDFNVVFVFGGLRTLITLMRSRSYKERRKEVESWMRQLNPETCTQWQQHWSRFGLQYTTTLTRRQASAALGVKLEDHEIFMTSARAVLERKGLLERTDDDLQMGTPQQCTDFLDSITGYSVLQTLPSMRPLQVGPMKEDEG